MEGRKKAICDCSSNWVKKKKQVRSREDDEVYAKKKKKKLGGKKKKCQKAREMRENTEGNKL